jgi:N-acetylglucosaminyldiphosphoundecaprenol N-acetyl-beta-D-mannosaminyltransferase
MNILNCRVDALDFDGTIRRACELVEERRFATQSSVNALKYVLMRDDAELRRAMDASDIISADGMPVVWLSRLLGSPLPCRVSGCDLFPELVRVAAKRGWPVYFLGARKDVVEDLVAVYRQRFPGLVVAGFRDGYFSPAEDEAVARAVGASGARLLFIALPSPRKEMFTYRNASHLEGVFCMGVGGSFDVETGRVTRAPMWMRRTGLESLWRAVQEPRKMMKRTATVNTTFIWMATRALLSGRRERQPDAAP